MLVIIAATVSRGFAAWLVVVRSSLVSWLRRSSQEQAAPTVSV
jgi:hypothetical protein